VTKLNFVDEIRLCHIFILGALTLAGFISSENSYRLSAISYQLLAPMKKRYTKGHRAITKGHREK
jgi:hypothetical protein